MLRWSEHMLLKGRSYIEPLDQSMAQELKKLVAWVLIDVNISYYDVGEQQSVNV